MISPAPESGQAPAPPTELSADEAAPLRRAAGWARFSAVVGFVLAALCVAGVVAGVYLVGLTAGPGRLVAAVGSYVVAFASTIAAALLLWGYAVNVGAFFAKDPAALALAFRHLRRFFALWTVFAALITVWRIVSVLQTIYWPL